MKVIILGSGSQGNATYIETPGAKILIDAGLSGLQIKKRLELYNCQLNDLDAILITHEHTDHTKGLIQVLKTSNATVYLSPNSYHGLNDDTQMALKNFSIVNLLPQVDYTIGDLHFIPIPLSHDVYDIFGFLVKSPKQALAYITDTGTINPKYYPILKHMDMLIIESNHDSALLAYSNRPLLLKKRISSKYGHLSNKQCAECLKAILSEKTKVVVLAHLSAECNEPSLAIASAKSVITNPHIKLYIATQDQPLPITDLEVS